MLADTFALLTVLPEISSVTDMEKARKECTHSNPAYFRTEYTHSSLSLLFVAIWLSGNVCCNDFVHPEVIYAFANIPYLLTVHRLHKLGGYNCL